MRIVLSVLLALIIHTADLAHAQITLPSARQRLAAYDVHDMATTEVIRELGIFIGGSASDAEKREARFLRASTAADLVLLSRVRRDDALLDRVALALSVHRNEVVARIDAELWDLTAGPYTDAANEARELLRVVDPAPSDLMVVHGLRRDYFFLRAVLRRAEGAPDAAPVLEALGSDPCGGPCTGVLASLDPGSRKVFSTMRELRRLVQSVKRAQSQRDPFASALEDVDTLAERLTALPISLRYIAPTTAQLTPTAVEPAAPTAATTPDAIAFISAQELRVAFLPRILVTSDGAASVDSRNPTYPGGTTIRMPASLPTTVASLDALVGPLRERFSGARIALAGTQTVPSHVVARIALTLRAAGAQIVAVTGITRVGTLAFFPVSLATAESNAAVVVVARPTGFEVRTSEGRVEVPHLQSGTSYRLDLEGLARRLGERRRETAEIRYTRDFPFAGIIGVVAHVRANRPPTLVLSP